MFEEEQDELRVGCFQQTGLLLIWQPDIEKDKLVKPQNMT